jgi:hydrogenase maturation factor
MVAPSVLLGATIGEDAAAIRVPAPIVVASTDPITFAAERAGWYAVHVGANDVATRGADPRWLLLTVLLPAGSASEELVTDLLRQAGDACRELGITLIGGHTEVTDAVTRPVLSTTVLGSLEEGRLLRTGGMQPGDAILLTRHCPIEGAAILAREFGAELLARGVPQGAIDVAAAFVDDPGISVVSAARAARSVDGVHALHDPTEGGVLCGLWEMAHASGVSVAVTVADIPVSPEARALCDALGLDPLGTIASGALLVACDSDAVAEVEAALASVGVPSTPIGRVVARGAPDLFDGEPPHRLRWSARDEIARLFAD